MQLKTGEKLRIPIDFSFSCTLTLPSPVSPDYEQGVQLKMEEVLRSRKSVQEQLEGVQQQVNAATGQLSKAEAEQHFARWVAGGGGLCAFADLNVRDGGWGLGGLEQVSPSGVAVLVPGPDSKMLWLCRAIFRTPCNWGVSAWPELCPTRPARADWLQGGHRAAARRAAQAAGPGAGCQQGGGGPAQEGVAGVMMRAWAACGGLHWGCRS